MKTNDLLNICPNWKTYFKNTKLDKQITDIIDNAYNTDEFVFPRKNDVLNLFKLIDINKIKVVIIGQDPYHGIDQANGIAFSVYNDVKTPPSLKNIFKELYDDLNIDHFNNNDLSEWVKQGVFLINSYWTVKNKKPLSHSKIGWDIITLSILNEIIKQNKKIIFCLFGNDAKKTFDKLNVNTSDLKNISIIKTTHPSPFSYHKGFRGSKIFSKINNILISNNMTIIDWSK